MISFSNALWTGFELIQHTPLSKTIHTVIVKPIGKTSINTLLSSIINSCKIQYVKEKKASMNDIFIRAVKENQLILEGINSHE